MNDMIIIYRLSIVDVVIRHEVKTGKKALKFESNVILNIKAPDEDII